MQVKISLKTILLFAALFILGTMILGFYSCSSGGATVTPQMADEWTDEDTTSTLQPGTTVLSDGTIVTTDGSTTIVTTTTPADGDGTGTDTTTTITYELVINEDGTPDLRTVREGQSVEDEPSYELTFSTFVETAPDVWEGTVTVLNNDSLATLLNPRIAYIPPMVSAMNSRGQGVLENVLSPDLWWAEALPGTLLPVAHPLIFVADEDENYAIGPSEEATHDITILSSDGAVLAVYLMGEASFDGNPTTYSQSVPHGIDISLVENPSIGSMVTVELDVDHWNSSQPGYIMFDTEGGGVILHGIPLPLEFVGDPGGIITYQGAIVAKPSVDGETTVTVYFPGGKVGTDLYRHTYVQMVTYS